VTCNTCHHGTLKPEAEPVPDVEHWIRISEQEASLPEATDLIARYRRLVAANFAKIPSTQVASIQVETYSGKGVVRHATVDVLQEGFDRIRMTEQDGQRTMLFIKNGHAGWINDGKTWRSMDDDDSDTLNQRAGNLEPDQVGEQPSPRTVLKEGVYGHTAYVVETGSGDNRKRFYFDAPSGLLLRQRIFFTSMYADGSMDFEYADYRKVGRWMLPFTIRTINAGGSGLTIRRIVSRKVNVQIKPAEFSK